MLARFSLAAMLICLAACSEPKPTVWNPLEAAHAQYWHLMTGAENGEMQRTAEGELTLTKGKPMTCARFDAWESLQMPVSNYVIEFEAMRVEGPDFFAAVTFPVRRMDTCATLVVGGWGGGLVGVSSIDGQDASENATRSEHRFENNQWYHFRLEIRDDDLQGWMNGNRIINASIKARTIGLRIGDIEKCAPFGFATYFTTGKVKNLVVSKL